MMHQPSGGIGGTATDIAIQAELILHMKTRIAELIAEHTGQTVEQIDAGLRPRPLVHRRRRPGVRLHRPRRHRTPARSRRRRDRGPDASRPRPRRPERDTHELEHQFGHAAGCHRLPGRLASRYILPQFEERTSYGFKRQDPYTKLFEDRIIFLGVQVDDASADDVMAQLLVLECAGPRPRHH